MNSWTFMCHQDSSVGEGSEIQTLIGQRNNLEMVDQTPPWSNVIQHPCISNMIPTRIGFMHNHQIMDALGQIQVALLQHKGKATLQRIEQQWCNPIASAWNPAVQGTKLAAKTTNQIQTPEISAWPAERSPFKELQCFFQSFFSYRRFQLTWFPCNDWQPCQLHIVTSRSFAGGDPFAFWKTEEVAIR